MKQEIRRKITPGIEVVSYFDKEKLDKQIGSVTANVNKIDKGNFGYDELKKREKIVIELLVSMGARGRMNIGDGDWEKVENFLQTRGFEVEKDGRRFSKTK